MRVPNDIRLATEVPEIHMILGGHDHHYEEKWVSTSNDKIKSTECVTVVGNRDHVCIMYMYCK